MKPFIGVSAYSAAAWDKKTVEAYFKCFPPKIKRPATALLWGPWGQPTKFAKEFIARFGDRPHLIEIHISAETARRTGRDGRQICKALSCGRYNAELIANAAFVRKAVQKRVQIIQDKIGPLTNERTTVMLSVGLEDTLGVGASTLIDLVREQLKSSKASWKTVRNPMLRQPRIFTELVEGHGRTYHPGQEIWNFDGVHVGKIDSDRIEDIGYEKALETIRAANKQYRALFLWSALAQGWKNVSAQPYAGRTFLISEIEQEGFKAILRGIA